MARSEPFIRRRPSRRRALEDGSRALLVLATGLGKTWLAAFDVLQLAQSLDRWPRVLFLAHRGELLAQAALTEPCSRSAPGGSSPLRASIGRVVVVEFHSNQLVEDRNASARSDPKKRLLVVPPQHTERERELTPRGRSCLCRVPNQRLTCRQGHAGGVRVMSETEHSCWDTTVDTSRALSFSTTV
jgi:hypothetical protein